MRTVRTKIYQFNELNDKAKQVAIENFRDNQQEIFLDFFNEYCLEQIEEAGFKGKVSLNYSLSYSQGDGLSFNAEYFDKLNDIFKEVLGEAKQKSIDAIINESSFTLKSTNNYYCYASKNDLDFTLENYSREYKNIDLVIGKVREKLEDLYINLCKDLENKGYSEIEYQNSDEYITEEIINNKYEFTENGNLFF